MTWNNWWNAKPDNAGGNEHYVHMYANHNYQWNDYRDSTRTFQVICIKKGNYYITIK